MPLILWLPGFLNSLLCGILEKPLTKSSYTLAHLTCSFKAVLSAQEAGLALAEPYSAVPLCKPHTASLCRTEDKISQYPDLLAHPSLGRYFLPIPWHQQCHGHLCPLQRQRGPRLPAGWGVYSHLWLQAGQQKTICWRQEEEVHCKDCI